MKYCEKCLQPNTRLNSIFTDKGICPACNYFHKLLGQVNWREKTEILLDIAKSFPKSNQHDFDCIVGVSGGKDSVSQALFVRDKLDLNPLLACLSYPPQQVTQQVEKILSQIQ